MNKEEKNLLTLRSPIIPSKWQIPFGKQHLLWARKYAPTTNWTGVSWGMLSAEIPSSEPTTLSPGLGHRLLPPGISVLSLRESHGSKLQPFNGASTSKSKGDSHTETWLVFPGWRPLLGQLSLSLTSFSTPRDLCWGWPQFCNLPFPVLSFLSICCCLWHCCHCAELAQV